MSFATLSGNTLGQWLLSIPLNTLLGFGRLIVLYILLLAVFGIGALALQYTGAFGLTAFLLALSWFAGQPVLSLKARALAAPPMMTTGPVAPHSNAAFEPFQPPLPTFEAAPQVSAPVYLRPPPYDGDAWDASRR